MKSLRTLFFASLALLGVLASASAQGWVAKYSPGTYTTSYKLKVDSSGNTYVTGVRRNAANADILLLKYNTSGALAWATTYAGASDGDDEPTDLVLDSSGNVYITG